MKCPQCLENFGAADSDKPTLHECLFCEGVWVPRCSIEQILGDRGAASEFGKMQTLLVGSVRSASRKCPQCSNEFLNAATVKGVEIDLCQKCHGVFFDKGEMQWILGGLGRSEGVSQGATAWAVTEGLIWALLLGGSR